MATEPAPSLALIISELPPGTDESQLRRVFGPYGELKSLHSLGPGKVRIVFTTQDDATWIRENLDGNIPEGLSKPIGVSYSCTVVPPPAFKGVGKAPSQPGESPYGAQGASAGPYASGKGWAPAAGMPGQTPDSIQVLKQGLRHGNMLPKGYSSGYCNLQVTNLPADTCDVDLFEIFAPFGGIPTGGVRAMQSQDGRCSGMGFVTYFDAEHAHAALGTLNGTVLPSGTVLRVATRRPASNAPRARSNGEAFS